MNPKRVMEAYALSVVSVDLFFANPRNAFAFSKWQMAPTARRGAMRLADDEDCYHGIEDVLKSTKNDFFIVKPRKPLYARTAQRGTLNVGHTLRGVTAS